VCVGTCVLTTTALIPLCWIMSACQPPYLACQVTVVVNQSIMLFRVVQVTKSLQDPLEVGNSLLGISDNVRE